ncbi:MAG: acyl-CoA thioesterase [candidate division KSB1 bacterium]|nr:acyl-CoA thioesterase [candidate division KSB1 bacterium]MDZ7366746.1 acyl-CoA thioesterase [candidate division KSB1 bacterium]MDZ7404759.1 acyl-CoA thioesterase [candidate division KSB1 bacterium]
MLVNTTYVRVRYADTDKMGITYYSKYLEWFEVGRTEMLRDIGFPYTQLEKEGIGLPVIEAYCRYHRAARYDQLLRIVSTVKTLPRVTIRIEYKIYNEQQELLVDGYTTHPFIGKAGKPVRAPKSLLEVLQPYFQADPLDLPSEGANGKNGQSR